MLSLRIDTKAEKKLELARAGGTEVSRIRGPAHDLGASACAQTTSVALPDGSGAIGSLATVCGVIFAFNHDHKIKANSCCLSAKKRWDLPPVVGGWLV